PGHGRRRVRGLARGRRAHRPALGRAAGGGVGRDARRRAPGRGRDGLSDRAPADGRLHPHPVTPSALAAPDTMDGFYRTVRRVARFWGWFLFKRVHAHHRERVPPSGPVLLGVNPPHNFIASPLVGAVMRRKVHYLATAALFRNPLLGRFLRAAGAIPVYRRQDDPDKMDRNVEVFAACYRAFDDGRVVAIYPEGTTHAEARV